MHTATARRSYARRHRWTYLAALISLLLVTSADAMTYPDAVCRSTIRRISAKLAAVAMKRMNSCMAAALKTGQDTDCNDLGVADTDGDLAALGDALHASMQTKCAAGSAVTPAVLAQFPSCPSPADAEDGANDAVDDFDELADCQITLNTKTIESLYRHILRPNAPAIFDDVHGKKAIATCVNAIGKAAVRLWSRVAKERGYYCQTYSDKTQAGGYEYACSSYDQNGRIAAEVIALGKRIDYYCARLTGSQLALLRTCDTTLSGIKTCVANAVKRSASGLTAVAFDMDQVCPTQVRIELNAGTGTDGRLTQTVLDTGWTGLGHGTDIGGAVLGRVGLSCADTSCVSCAIAARCEEGNCRCSNNAAVPCSVPFTQDVCGAGNTCIVHVTPPLALNAIGRSTCVTNTIVAQLAGTADVGRGESTTQLTDISKVFLGISQNRPCPTCENGVCNGGARNGAACTVDAIHPDFGAVAHDCPPTLVLNISGAGLKTPLTLTNGAVSLASSLPCDGSFSGSNCPCGACSGDVSVACHADADCTAMGLGTCGGVTFAPDRRPNACSDPTCEDIGNGIGQCSGAADTLKFCDGFVRKGGGGIVPCFINADCDAVDCDDSTPAADGCGDCTHEEQRSCFLDPIEATGMTEQDGGVVASTFCYSLTTNSWVNNAYGLPGPGRVVMDLDFTAYCPDGVTEFELGGANCP